MGGRKLTVSIVGDASSLESAFTRAAKGGVQLERRSKGLKIAAAASGAALTALGAATAPAIEAASSLSEAQNAVNVVFGKSAGVINEFAQTSAQEAGLSMRELNELVTPVGAALQNYGFSAQDAATNSIELAKRAADMASVFNTSVPDALAAIQAGLRGEADPLERFGVGLSDAAVRAKAVSMGLADTTATVDDNAKMQARLALIMEQTNKVQGDFARTSDGAANAARINAAATEDLQAKMGRGLLPAVELVRGALGSLLGFLGSHVTLTKVLTGVVAGLAGVIVLASTVTKVHAALTGAAAVAKAIFTTSTVAATGATVGQTAAQEGLNVAMRLNPIGIVITALAGLAVGLVVAYKKSETFRAVVKRAFDVVRVAVTAVSDAVGWVLDKAVEIKNWSGWGRLGGIIAKPFKIAVTPILAVIDAINTVISVAQSALNLIGKLKSGFTGGTDPSKTVTIPGVNLGGGFPKGASGGVVTRPTLALIGEAGPEAVIPLNRTPGSSPLPAGRGSVIVNVYGSVLSERDLVDVVRRGFIQAGRRLPSLGF